MAGWIEKSFLAGLGVLTLTRDRVKQFVDKLVKEGEVEPEDAPGIVDKLVTRGEAEREELDKLVRQELNRMTPVFFQDMEELDRKVDEQAAQIENLAAQVEKLAGEEPEE